MNILRLLFLSLILHPFSLLGQITIGDGTTMLVSGTITTDGNIISNVSGNTLNLERAELVLNGQDQDLFTAPASRVKIGNLTVNGGGVKTLSGQWEVTLSLSLNNGILTTDATDGSSRIVFSGSGLPETITANENSFVEGVFYSRGKHFRKFPIGSGGVFAPAALEDIENGDVEIGMQVINGDARLVGTVEMESVLNTRYWVIDALEPVNSTIQLSATGLSTENPWIVVQAPGPNSAAEGLGGSLENFDFVISALKVTAANPIVTLAIPTTFDITINDLITPFTIDDANDVLIIDNINLTEENTVTLLDRWGVSHRVWKNYDSTNPAFDFKKLTPGNYICVVEYKLPGSTEKKTKSQMVTVLRTN